MLAVNKYLIAKSRRRLLSSPFVRSSPDRIRRRPSPRPLLPPPHPSSARATARPLASASRRPSLRPQRGVQRRDPVGGGAVPGWRPSPRRPEPPPHPSPQATFGPVAGPTRRPEPGCQPISLGWRWLVVAGWLFQQQLQPSQFCPAEQAPRLFHQTHQHQRRISAAAIPRGTPARPRRPRRQRRTQRQAHSSLSSLITRSSTVAAMLRNFPQARRLLRRMGFEKEDAYFWKQMGKAMLCTYTLFGVAWLWNETSPLGWWTLKPRPKEEKEMAHLYERRKFPYPGDEEAVEEFIKSGGALGTTIGPKGFADANMDSDNMQKQLQSKKFDQEAQKLWLRMRNEVIQELQEKGFDIE